MTKSALISFCLVCDSVITLAFNISSGMSIPYVAVCAASILFTLVPLAARTDGILPLLCAIDIYASGSLFLTRGSLGYLPLFWISSFSSGLGKLVNVVAFIIPIIVLSVSIVVDTYYDHTNIPHLSTYYPAHVFLCVLPSIVPASVFERPKTTEEVKNNVTNEQGASSLMSSSVDETRSPLNSSVDQESSGNGSSAVSTPKTVTGAQPPPAKDHETLLDRRQQNKKNWKDTATKKMDIKWRKGVQIGRGAYGTVHIALNEVSGELMAVKNILFDIRDKRFQKRIDVLQTELAMLRMLEHPNIVHYYFTEKTSTPEGVQGVNIFMEYVPGGSILTVLQQFGPLSEPVVASYTEQILLALKYLHDNNVVHRDIKSANVLLTTDGSCKVADFGAAAVLEGISSQQRSIAGTPLWMAPEVLQELPFDWRADVWSLGCTVMEMLTAKTPFYHLDFANPMSILNHILTATSDSDILRPQTLAGRFSESCLSFLQCCICKDPKKRKSCEELLQHPFVNVVGPSAHNNKLSESGEVLAFAVHPTFTHSSSDSSKGSDLSKGSDQSLNSDTSRSSVFRTTSSRVSQKDIEREEKRRQVACERDSVLRQSLVGGNALGIIESSSVVVATKRDKDSNKDDSTTEDPTLEFILRNGDHQDE